MKVIKRNGNSIEYNQNNISKAIQLACNRVNDTSCNIDSILKTVEDKLYDGIKVEEIQDIVEETLIFFNLTKVAKEYITYRAKKNETRESYENLRKIVDTKYHFLLRDIRKSNYHVNFNSWFNRYSASYKENINTLDLLIKTAVECTTADNPEWDKISGYLYYYKVKFEVEETCKELNLNSLFDKVVYGYKNNIYNSTLAKINILTLNRLEEYIIETEFDNLFDKFTYSSIDLLYKRYLAKTPDGKCFENIYEMFMLNSLYIFNKLFKLGKYSDAFNLIKDSAKLMFDFKYTTATPTMFNARRNIPQLSSCFIDTVEDSLIGIFRSITEFAKISKYGGGMGIYMGKVRAIGSDIRGFKGVAGGVIRWVKIFNDTAVAVDQTGIRVGSCAITLDIWHKDIPEFLQVRTNNGDDRMKAHDIFPAVSIPDLFWELIENDINNKWYLFCPHEIKTKKGYSLEDFYGEEWKEKYYECINDKSISKRELTVKDLLKLIIKSAVETGTPFLFNRDTVNKDNPVKDKGMIYSSNLCVEIAQNMSPIQHIKEYKLEDNIFEVNESGNFVTCNLASLNLSKFANWQNNEIIKQDLENTIKNIVYLLDNVITVNELPIKFAIDMNNKYRAIGLGTSGYHHLLALEGIQWESEEHIKYADKLFEFINYCALKASNELAKIYGKCYVSDYTEYIKNSYYEKKGYLSKEWQELKNNIQTYGIRNAYLLAIAPTGSTSIIAGTTAGIDPVQNKFFLEEKKSGIVPRVAPDLNNKTFWLYKDAHNIDHNWTIRAAGARQKHIDQSQSLNLFINHNYSFRDILNLYLLAWKQGIKTLYYVRSKALEVEDCVSCSS